MTPVPHRGPVDPRRPHVDVATGRLVVVDHDPDLPDLLAALLTRTYVSTWSRGLSIDTRWAWGLDERVEADELGLRLVGGDGTVLRLDLPSDDGADAPVRRAPDGGYVVADPRSGWERHYLGAVPGGVPLAAVRDRDGRRVSVVRSAGGRPVQVRDTGGHRVLLEAEDGLVRRVHHLPPGAAPREFELVHDDRGRLVEVRSPGGATRFEIDVGGRLTGWSDQEVDLRFGLDADGAVVLASDGRTEVRIERRDGVVAESVHSRAVVSTHDDAGRRTSRTTPSGAVAMWTHDQDGRPVSASAAGLEVGVARDAAGRVVRRHLDDVAVLDIDWTDGGSGESRLRGQRLRRVPRIRPATGASLADRLGGGAPGQGSTPPVEAPRELLSQSYPVEVAPPDPPGPPADPDVPTDPLGRPVLPGVVWDGDLVAETTTGPVTTTWTYLDEVPVVRETRDATTGCAHAAYVLTGVGGEVVALVTPDGEVLPGDPDGEHGACAGRVREVEDD